MKSPWLIDMCNLLLWMRSQKMPFLFCADVISREVGRKVTKHSCVSKFRKLKGNAR